MGGMYPLKAHPTRWVLTELPGSKIDQKTGLIKVREVGTGFKAISSDTLLTLIRAHPEREYVADDRPERTLQHDLFPMGVVNGRYLTEDYYFDHLCHQAGIPVYVDTRVKLKHRGTADFPLTELPLPGVVAT